MNSREALRLADPARRLPPHRLDATEEAVLQAILTTDAASGTATKPAAPPRRVPRLDRRTALITGVVAAAVVATTVLVVHSTSNRAPAPATTTGRAALEAAVQARLLDAADGRDIDPDQPSLVWTEQERGGQGDMIDLTGKTLYLAGACSGGGTVTIRISGEPDTVLRCTTLTAVGPIDLTELVTRQKKGISVDVVATAGDPDYLVEEIGLPTARSSTTASSNAPITDRGSQQYARGTARLVDGVYRYEVAQGDTVGGIAARFGTSQDAVAAASRGGFEIFEGDVLRITR